MTPEAPGRGARRPARPNHLRAAAPLACVPSTRQGRRRIKRAAQRTRTRRAVVQPPLPATAHAVHEALEALSGEGGSGRGSAALGVLALLSVALHVGVGLAVWRGHFAPPATRAHTRITARVYERPVAPPVEKKPAPVTAPAAKSPKALATRVRPAATTPVPAAAATPQPPAPVKVVGLSLESTSEAGDGPAFAVGNTLAGSTADTAAVPTAKTAAVPVAASSPVRPPGPNRVAHGAGAPGSVLTPPRRLHEVKPHYPNALRAAGVEADVLLVVSLDAHGKVIAVTVGKGGGELSFDEAARTAALQERFSPALRDGTPVPTTLSFTTHFRLDLP